MINFIGLLIAFGLDAWTTYMVWDTRERVKGRGRFIKIRTEDGQTIIFEATNKWVQKEEDGNDTRQ
jgi:hypothetical protein